LGLLTAACYDTPQGVFISGASSITPIGRLSPNPIVLAPFAGTPCASGFAFNIPFNLSITAGVHDLTLDSVTIHMIDGSNLGGPSVTIPRPELARSGSTVIGAGTTRDFALNPIFGCIINTPRSLVGSAIVFDQRGLTQTLPLSSSIR
jgi:hypothetical protein